jgi:biotin carboxylase
LDDVTAIAEKSAFPLVVKQPVASASKGVDFINDKNALLQFYDTQEKIDAWPIVQDYVLGDFYGFTAVCDRGKVLSYFMFWTKAEYSLGGTPPYAFSTNDPQLLAQSEELIKQLGWHGAIDLDFIKNGENYYLLEINPRFSGTINFAYRSGVNLPRHYCQLAFGEKVQSSSYKSGLTYRTVLPVEARWCLKNKKGWGKFWLNCFNIFIKTNIYLDDPNLFWWQIKQTWWQCQDLKRKSFISN